MQCNSKAPKSFFLFMGTPLVTCLKRMKRSKAVLDRLKPQECKQGSGHGKPPKPCILEKDELQEAVEATANMIKVTLLGKVELQVSVWSRRTPEQFIMYVQHPINTIKQKGLKETYNRLVGTENWRRPS